MKFWLHFLYYVKDIGKYALILRYRLDLAYITLLGCRDIFVPCELLYGLVRNSHRVVKLGNAGFPDGVVTARMSYDIKTVFFISCAIQSTKHIIDRKVVQSRTLFVKEDILAVTKTSAVISINS